MFNLNVLKVYDRSLQHIQARLSGEPALLLRVLSNRYNETIKNLRRLFDHPKMSARNRIK
jgi:hypothetical protein